MGSVVEISPLTRVEGHGRVLVHRNGRQVERVELVLCESPRLFEALLVGKSYRELPEIICRICSLCSTVHRAASVLAIEDAFGIEVSGQTSLHRELIVLGGQIQSHALHLFCLVLPDLYGLQGLDSLARTHPDILSLGLRLKQAGNTIQELVGGRLIHPVTLLPGGMGRPVSPEGLAALAELLSAACADALETFDLFKRFPRQQAVLPSRLFMAVHQGASPALHGTNLACSDGRSFPVKDYAGHLAEYVVGYSNAKQSRWEGRPVIVGALARLRLGQELQPQAARARGECGQALLSGDVTGNTLAQAVELIHAVERSREIVALLGSRREPPEKVSRFSAAARSGVAAVEAPRGTLIHRYGFDAQGICRAADIVTPTSINQAALEQDLFALARSLEGAEDAEMTTALEHLVRVYDPCISCAVHLVRC